MKSEKIANGIFWVEIPEADMRILCGCPADSVKHLIKRGLIAPITRNGVLFETGPNAILLSDTSTQKGSFANLAEFPLLQMFYRQGMIIPGHPGNTGRKPLLIGLGEQVRAQSEYVMRGNYGLLSREEIEACGVPSEAAAEMMAVKMRFAFGKIMATDELVDTRAVDSGAAELAPGVVVHRRGLNRYEFLAAGQAAKVDLNLALGEEYQPAYALPAMGARRERFSVIHTGEGDGWDPHRPCVASIVCSGGEYYAIDAGPFITHTLDSLGLDVTDLSGIFHTHAHDDHFAGLTSLVRSERRLRYYATPLVRASVQKKLAALMRMEEGRFSRYFEVHDLLPEEWNTVGDMEVRPVYSPHPVETTMFVFRSGRGADRRTYAHLVDLSSRSVLEKMAASQKDGPGLSRQRLASLLRHMREPADVKKVDAGGGAIHGDALDFTTDASPRLLLSHGITVVPDGFSARASIASFGDADVLIPNGTRTYLRQVARLSLAAWFPRLSGDKREELSSCPILDFTVGATVAPGPGAEPDALLILTGIVQETHPGNGQSRRITAGSFTATSGTGLSGSAVGNVSVLAIPRSEIQDLGPGTGVADRRRPTHAAQDFLALCPLFSGVRSQIVLNRIAAAMDSRLLVKGQSIVPSGHAELFLLADGEANLTVGPHFVESIGPGGYWGEERIVSPSPGICEARASADCTCYAIPAAALVDIPIVQWDLLETFQRRLRSFRVGFRFEWYPVFSVGVAAIDEEHRALFAFMDDFSEMLEESGTLAGHDPEKRKLLELTASHFQNEESLMARHGYARLAIQKQEHAILLSKLEAFVTLSERRSRPRSGTAVDYMKDWLITHILIEDLQYREAFSRAGVS